MSEEDWTLEDTAEEAWYAYHGDNALLKRMDGTDFYDDVHETLKQNYIDGFMAGFMLRLTGGKE